jgi:hypothetical protein
MAEVDSSQIWIKYTIVPRALLFSRASAYVSVKWLQPTLPTKLLETKTYGCNKDYR